MRTNARKNVFQQVYWLGYFSDIDVAVHSRAGRFAGRRIHICDSLLIL